MAINPRDFYSPKVLDAQLTGMIKTREPNTYSARLRIPMGILTADALEDVAAVARAHGRGEVYLTVRMGIEIPGVQTEDFPALRQDLAARGVALAGCGPRMRSTTACKGTVCPHGNLDVFDLAWRIDRAHNDAAVLPHKFKVGVAGCASSCSKPQTNDVGLVGVSEPELDPGACVNCGICAETCHLAALRLQQGLPAIDRGLCASCGDCIKACPVQALALRRTGVDLYAGGRWGREKQVGMRLGAFLSEDEAVGAVGRIKAWYAAEGRKKERLGQTMVRLGPRACQEAALAGVSRDKWVAITAEAEERLRPFR